MTEQKKRKPDEYKGFEQGPIRPPSEAASLLIRLTRNCPWNHCTFCPVYKKRTFSLRSMENIIRDIDLLHTYVSAIVRTVESGIYPSPDTVNDLFNRFEIKDRMAFNAAMHWYSSGMESIFLQDANSLIMKPEDLITILKHIRKCFPMAGRITSYARSHTVSRISDDHLKQMADAGLNRIHIGMESGSDRVLRMVKKGSTKAMHIKAGQKVKKAGMELSEYVMPGLGGIDLSIEHALETAEALNAVNADFIRIRTLAMSGKTPLVREYQEGRFQKCTDIMMAQELRLFIENLDGITSVIKSDHILNLFETLEGKLPEDREKMLGIIDRFFDLDPEDRALYQVGRRMGFFRDPGDLETSPHLEKVKQTCQLYGVSPDNVDRVTDELMKRFV